MPQRFSLRFTLSIQRGGAQRADVVRLMLADGIRLAAVGIGLGILISLALAAGLRTYLFGIGPTDLGT